MARKRTKSSAETSVVEGPFSGARVPELTERAARHVPKGVALGRWAARKMFTMLLKKIQDKDLVLMYGARKMRVDIESAGAFAAARSLRLRNRGTASVLFRGSAHLYKAASGDVGPRPEALDAAGAAPRSLGHCASSNFIFEILKGKRKPGAEGRRPPRPPSPAGARADPPRPRTLGLPKACDSS
ncbi:hypothetical protein EVAR_96607_1 [Eumeta japonica]|uniref:Uncharacterized protein n=1 Tax=Eumeta variegata TaxID=151549 RepID=A0A4C1WUM9_EUMVA|nr:hypothetical protein EVAR_96607_1 [Eumeta japonica]